MYKLTFSCQFMLNLKLYRLNLENLVKFHIVLGVEVRGQPGLPQFICIGARAVLIEGRLELEETKRTSKNIA